MSRAHRSPRLASAHEDDALAFRRLRIGGVAQWMGLFSIANAVTSLLFDARQGGVHGFAFLLAEGREPKLVFGAFLVAVSRVLDHVRLRRRALDALDIGLALVACASFDGSLFGAPPELHFELTLALTSTNFLLARAAIVPSTGARTALVGVLATAVLVVCTFVAYRLAGARDAASSSAFIAAQWGAIAVTSSALLSHRLYALQRRADAAERFGQYTLEEKIGEGGMGEVFRARHALLKRATALKLLPRARAGAEAIARFEREVQVTSRLTHPNTIHIYDFGYADDGTFYYAMELIDGMTLDELVTECGAQAPGRVAKILADVCASLAEAHGAGLVHRDIKPQNVMLCARGGLHDVVKVLDFGLVKALGEVGSAGSGPRATSGTPAYMAPEAFEHPEQLGPASDLYAVGALGYFLLTGAHVFGGATTFELYGQHLHATPIAPSERAGRPIPPALERLVLACLAKSPEDRPASADVLRSLLLKTESEHASTWSDADAASWWQGRARAEAASASGERLVSSRALRVTLA